MERAGLISVGTELTLGQIVDTNAAWLAQRLASLGIRAERHLTIPDEAPLIRAALLEAAAAHDVVVITGGLGPTQDDLTRPALAEAAGGPLELDPASLAAVEAFFAARQRPMPVANRVQAFIPRGAQALRNECGIAPGVALELSGTPCYALPGVPFEMRAMFEREVEPLLQAATRGRVIASRRLHTIGLGESDVAGRIADLMERGRNPEVGTTAELGVISVRINATAQTHDEAAALLGTTEAEVRQRLGAIVFGGEAETLASAVGALLTERGWTVATAESCTGGLIAKLLTDVPGSSAYFLGAVVAYANEAKVRLLGADAALIAQHGAVSEPVARAMADGACQRFGSTYALAVTGVAGPSGGTAAKPVGLVYVGLAGPTGASVRRLQLGTQVPRDAIRTRAAWSALNTLRLDLLKRC